MKLIIFITFFLTFNFCFDTEGKGLKKKLSVLKKQTVVIHNDILKNDDELNKIKIDIEKNSQKKTIFEKHIKDKEVVSRRLLLLLQDKIYISPVNKFIKNLTIQSDDLITKQIVREFFLKQAKTSINQHLESIEGIEEITKELDKKIKVFEKKKKDLRQKLKILEKKMKEVSKLQKKVKVDLALKIKEKKLKEKAKNLNELVSGVEKKKKSKILNKGGIQYPVRGEIISNFGEGKDVKKSKNGVVFKVTKNSFVTSPINGMVVYANQFRSYGNLVIIENDQGFYCILSGMKNILISSGIEVLKGEPIAKLNTGKNNQLYFELRLNGKIINPKSKVEIL